MNQSESNFYRWLIEEGNYERNQIDFEKSRTPDFVGPSEEWEVKKLYGNAIQVYSSEQIDYFREGGENSYLVIMPENPRENKKPYFILPCQEVLQREGDTFSELERWSVAECPHSIRYRKFKIRRLFKSGKRYHIYVKDEDLARWIEKEVEEGEFRSVSHAFEIALKKLKARRVEL